MTATATVECTGIPQISARLMANTGLAASVSSPSTVLDHHAAGEFDLYSTAGNYTCQFSAARTPAGNVGGDYLDLVRIGERRLGICVGDASGKGVPAAMLTARLQTAVRALAPDSDSAGNLIGGINRLLCATTASNKFITLFYGVLDGPRLTYTNAGHTTPPCWSVPNGEQLRLEQGGALLGVFPDWVYQQGEVWLAPGDRLVIFSDGITDAEDSLSDQFGEERLLDIVAAHRKLGATALRNKIISAVAAFSTAHCRTTRRCL